jgi:putative nucleotidyltransferase with HDIG domain
MTNIKKLARTTNENYKTLLKKEKMSLTDMFYEIITILAMDYTNHVKMPNDLYRDILTPFEIVSMSGNVTNHGNILSFYQTEIGKTKLKYTDFNKEIFERTLNNKYSEIALLEMYKSGVFDTFISELSKCFDEPQNWQYHSHDVFTHQTKTVKAINESYPNNNDIVLLLAGLFHDIGKPDTRTVSEHGYINNPEHPKKGAEITKKILLRLKYPEQLIKDVCCLIEHHNIFHNGITVKILTDMVNQIGYKLTSKLIKLFIADRSTQKYPLTEAEIKNINELFETVLKNPTLFNEKTEYFSSSLKKQQEPLLLLPEPKQKEQELAITSMDIIKNVPSVKKQGKEMIKILTLCKEYIKNNPDKNNKEDLIKFLNKKGQKI